MRKEYKITGMGCAACSAKIENKLRTEKGIVNISVNLLSEKMSIEFDEKIITEKNIKDIVIKLGYGIEEVQTSIYIESEKEEKPNYSLIFSIIFIIPLLYISMGHMINMPIPRILLIPEIFALSQFILTSIIIVLNKKYFISGIKHIFSGSPNMDSLIAIGSSAAFLYGIYVTINIFLTDNHTSHILMHELYYESAATILTLITFGKHLENKSKKKTGAAIKKLISLAPKTAIIYKDGKEIEIDTSEIQVGDIVVIKAGQTAPVDGIVVFGSASFDQAAITGESIPVYKEINDEITSATTNTSGYIRIKATRVGNDTTLAEIIKLMEEASNSKAPISKIADKVSGIFVPIVICIAVLTFIVWYMVSKEFSLSFSMAVSVLVISCPCALGLATPVAIMTGTGAGAKYGILVKSGEALEILSKINTMVFDKTGTITEGKPVVKEIISYSDDSELILKIAASAEQYSSHPLAKAIIEYAGENELLEASSYNDISGKGIIVEFNGEKYLVGSKNLIEENEISFKDSTPDPLMKGATIVYVADSKNVIGEIYISDQIRLTSKKALQTIKKHGLNTVILTGDGREAAMAVSEEVGADKTYYNVLPSKKAETISQMKQDGKYVCMIGDGINDAPALEIADVGIAVGSGTDIAIEAADIIIAQNNLIAVETAFRLSKAVMNNIKLNLFWAFIYNVIGIPIAAGVFYPLLGLRLNPMIGAFAMSVSSLCVVLNALRLTKFK